MARSRTPEEPSGSLPSAPRGYRIARRAAVSLLRIEAALLIGIAFYLASASIINKVTHPGALGGEIAFALVGAAGFAALSGRVRTLKRWTAGVDCFRCSTVPRKSHRCASNTAKLSSSKGLKGAVCTGVLCERMLRRDDPDRGRAELPRHARWWGPCHPSRHPGWRPNPGSRSRAPCDHRRILPGGGIETSKEVAVRTHFPTGGKR